MQKLFIFIAMLVSSAGAAAADDDYCFDVLRQSSFFYIDPNDDGLSDGFLRWQCATSFRKHKEALAIGLTPGSPMYGTALTKRGRWNKEHVETWKDENCSRRARKTSLEKATFKLVRRESLPLLASWARCMQETTNSAPLSCSMAKEGNLNIFSAALTEQKSDKGPAAEAAGARVKYWKVAGGNCHPRIMRKSEITTEPRESTCAANADANLVVMLETDKGVCWQTTESDSSKIVIDGRTVLSGNTKYEADQIELTATAEIITNGFDVVIAAKETLKIEGSPTITAFEADSARAPGTDGHNAGPIIIKAGAVKGSKLLIANHGEDGVAGIRGESGYKGRRGSPGRAGSDRGLKGCVGRKTGGKGGKGGAGKSGSPGGDAGDGGPVSISIRSNQFDGNYDRIIVEQARVNPFTQEEYRCKGTCPGAAAPGGAGGSGGPGGRGGSGVRGSWPCGGVSPGMKGPLGNTGQPGRNGKAGEQGSILIL